MTLDLSDEYVLSAMAAPDDEAAPDEPGLIVLDESIEWKGTRYTELRLREPLVAEVLFSTRVMGARATRSTAYAAQLDLVARVAKWPAAAIDRLPVRALDRAVAYVTDFEENARRPADEDPDLSSDLRLVLSPPVQAVGQDHGDMALHEPTVAQRKAYIARTARETPEAFVQGEIDLVAAVSGWPMAAVLKMPIGKFAQAADYLTGFFTRGPRTGPNYRAS
ncbi:phage tail assembly protein [Gluconacetobacter azotocaptans]|uniref:Phage tail assembly protein n=1 Tax=Gluconacetobacter azotocaptans TaxID=142834 RepID=A0A7W4JQX5_9PROT|nr:phage tail assembly protein [Gluconacetobacter azotocaptans]MBB2189213.1 phage tail assembly protein [Gluconacetobacter azotocaptans]GBQ32282.1 hypothetical protein AA13594_2321 [Gluconacetobacter azotocaptans DSM 13594]